jgi:hypothetical protein
MLHACVAARQLGMSIPMALIALAGGSWIFLAFVIIAIGGVVLGYFTYTGSGIDAHPSKGGADGSPGASEPSDAGGKGRVSDDAGVFDSHGSR